MELLNRLNEVGLKYRIETKEYHWCRDYEKDDSGEYLGFRIIVDISDKYKLDIVLAFNEATGQFYGDDIFDIAFKAYYLNDTRYWLLPEFEEPNGHFSTATICNGYEVVANIFRFMNEHHLEGS